MPRFEEFSFPQGGVPQVSGAFYDLTVEKKVNTYGRIIVDTIHCSVSNFPKLVTCYAGNRQVAAFTSSGLTLTLEGGNIFSGEIGETIKITFSGGTADPNYSGGPQFWSIWIAFSGRVEYPDILPGGKKTQPSYKGVAMPGSGIQPPINRKPSGLIKTIDGVNGWLKKKGIKL